MIDDRIVHCRNCNKPMNYTDRKHRGFYMKKFLFFLPLRPYWCTHCLRTTYAWGKSRKDQRNGL